MPIFQGCGNLKMGKHVLVKVVEMHKGYHDSTEDFPVKNRQTNKYDTRSFMIIQLDFGDCAYQLPRMFMHYINDVEAIGFSWEPPSHFIDCLKRGYQEKSFTETKKCYSIGFITKDKKNQIIDTQGGDNNDYASYVKTSDKITLDTRVLESLIEIEKNGFEIEEKACHYGADKNMKPTSFLTSHHLPLVMSSLAALTAYFTAGLLLPGLLVGTIVYVISKGYDSIKNKGKRICAYEDNFKLQTQESSVAVSQRDYLAQDQTFIISKNKELPKERTSMFLSHDVFPQKKYQLCKRGRRYG